MPSTLAGGVDISAAACAWPAASAAAACRWPAFHAKKPVVMLLRMADPAAIRAIPLSLMPVILS